MSTIQTLARAARVLFAAVPVFDMLKSTAKKTVIIPGFYKDGKFIAPHARVVHYNPDVTFHAVATGHGSHSQKAAHKELSGMDWWNTLSVDDKALHVMVLATDKQDAASASAAVSGWKAAALAGKNPKVGQWAAFVAQTGDKQAKLYDLVKEKAGGLAHLEIPKVQQVAALPVTVPVPAAEPVAEIPVTVPISAPAPTPEVVPAAPIPEAPPIAIAADGADYVAMLSTMAGGSFYQKEAVAKLKGSEGWDGISDQGKFEKADALYKQLQGAASAAAAVSMFKKTMLAGKVPTPAQLKAYNDLPGEKLPALVGAIIMAIGAEKYTELMALANAKATAVAPVTNPTGLPPHLAAIAPKLQEAMDAKATVADVTPAGYGPGEAAPAIPAEITPLDELHADVMKAGFKASKSATHGLVLSQTTDGSASTYANVKQAEATVDKLTAAGFLAYATGKHPYKVVISSKAPEMVNAAPVAAPATKKSSIPVKSETYVNIQDGHHKFWSVSVHGNVMQTSYGKIGTKGSSTEKTLPSQGAATSAMLHLKQQKLGKGYKLAGHDVHVYEVDVPAAAPKVASVAANQNELQGPKDGDTKTGADGETLVFKDGRWHKQGGKFGEDAQKQVLDTLASAGDVASLKAIIDANPSGSMLHDYAKQALGNITPASPNNTIALPDFSDDMSTWGAIYAKSAAALQTAFETGGVAAVKKLITIHKTGKLAGGYTVNCGVGKLKVVSWDKTPRRVKMHAYVAALLAATGGAKVKTVTAGAKSAPVAHSAPAMPSVPGGGTNMSSWVQTGEQAGSNPGGKFKDKAGTEWYCKFPADADIAKNELLAAKFYQMMGVAAPTVKLVNKDGKVGIASQWVDGLSKGSSEQLAKAKGAHEAFAIDAWLANWDVVGMGNDNLMLGKDGAAVRVDVGGSLLYRAQGGPKGAAFGTDVTELSTLLDHATNGKSAAVFGGVSKDSMSWGLGQLAKMKPSQITELCQKAGPGNDKAKEALAATLIARRANILTKMGISDPWDKPKIDESTLTVNVADLPKPIDFANFKGLGQGLSGNAKVNQQNSIDSAALIAFAKQGNLSALKNYQYDAFDKGTGAPLGKKPITDHPAKDIQSQWVGLVDLLSSIAYPPVESLEMPATGIASSMEELAEGAGYFNPADRVETVSAEHRMGFFMKLGHMDGVDDLVAGEKWNWITPTHSFVAATKAGYKKLSSIVRGYIQKVQASGSINHIWSLGKTTAPDGQGVFSLAAKVYAEAETLPDNMQMWRWMSDTTAGQGMMKQLLDAKPGLVIQNTDSMCCSYNEGWGKSAHFGTDVLMRVRCAKGSKATASFSSGSFSSENEITTLPGARFVVVKTSKGIPGNPSGVSLDVIMLPPDLGYVAELAKLEVMGKSMVIFLDSKWNNKQTQISAASSLHRLRAPSRAATLVTRIRSLA